jgi:hypothetical protein
MRSILLALSILLCGTAAQAQTTTVTITTTAQDDADHMARTGVFGHRGRQGRCREGIGFSTVSADDAVRRCCFYGQLRPREIGVARGRRGFYAVIRYW